jgi:O-antigen ligase
VIAAWIGDGLLQAVTGADVFGIVPPDGFITGPFRPNAIFGIILSILLPLVFWGPLKKREWWAPFLLCGTLVVIVLTGQRNNLLLAAIGLACISNLWSKRTRLVAASLFAATLIVTYPLSPALQERGAAMIDTFSQPPPPSKALESNPNASDTLLGKLNSLSSDRGYLLEAGIKMIQAQPISGIGLGAYKSSYPEFTTERPARKNIHAHNIYLGITAETGLLGLSAFLFAIAATSRWFLKSSPERQSSAIPYAYTLVVMLFPLATHTSLYRAFHFSIFLMVLCGFLSALYSPSIGECLNIDKEKDLASSEP